MKVHAYSLVVAALVGLASVSAHAASTPANLLGSQVTVESAERAIALDDSTRYVNVRFGETVRFDVNGKSFAVKFDGIRGSFDLNALAPAGVLNHPVKAYVSPSPLDERSL
ncbi:hypothetical protein CDO44_20085 [Pigmentiphaga sp. NML080357]|uniref:CzcE family metal-binding protein n=1 Tax=Pigmentiphaga sp. NML080357 TaxID=2008675 RepID=UPI000B4154A2|nr:CzcE family metal-binding protein [Pigmentiphaga sp. NML080357]OVZ56912.1 hypothetical protein CDO44_20085 [Pigmentiphaga sp. NML080357]